MLKFYLKKHFTKIPYFFLVLFVAFIANGILEYSALAGSLDSPSSPGVVMYTLDDIYNCLVQGGSACSVSPGGNLNPSSPPGSTMHSLTDIWQAIPWHNVAGAGTATSGDVCNGKTFYATSSVLIVGTRTACGVSDWPPAGGLATATSGDVCSGYTFYSTSSQLTTGTMNCQ